MVPNLDLILLSFLYGAFLSCILLLLAAAALFSLLLAFASTLLSIVVFDMYDVSSILGRGLGSAKADLELGSVLLLYLAMHFAVPAVLSSRPLIEQRVAELKEIAQRVMNHYHVL
ncbi:hypothetical protein CRG98_048225 [Punica granatum]|uniref:Uncharacterized protein n=1 Tax=Punica granatum TaxID=22663 RepID=A0A2I0HI64_PUNGR|nr:hypothetical protein CRG98_048225 [Punica granatum]